MQTIFLIHMMFANNLFCLFRPCKQFFFNIFHPPLQKNNGPSLIQQKYILHWQYTIQYSKKIEFYNSFKNEYTPHYLHLTRTLNNRKELVKVCVAGA